MEFGESYWKAVCGNLAAQRNTALDELAQSMAQNAILSARVKELEQQLGASAPADGEV